MGTSYRGIVFCCISYLAANGICDGLRDGGYLGCHRTMEAQCLSQHGLAHAGEYNQRGDGTDAGSWWELAVSGWLKKLVFYENRGQVILVLPITLLKRPKDRQNDDDYHQDRNSQW